MTIKVILPHLVKNHINELLELNENYAGNVEKVNLELLGAVWTITNINFETTKQPEKIKLQTGCLSVKGVNLYKLFFKNELHINTLEVFSPNLKLTKALEGNNLTSYHKPPSNAIRINNFKIYDGVFLKTGNQQDTLASLSLKKLVVKDIAVKALQDFTFFSDKQLEHLAVERFYLKLNKFENLHIPKFFLERGDLKINDLAIKTHYSKSMLTTKLYKERDYFDFFVKKITLENINFTFKKNEPELKIKKGLLKDFTLEVFRDKLLPDNIVSTAYYGQMLRSVPLKMATDSIILQNGNLVYSERIDLSREPSKLKFDTLEGTILNISNYKNTKIETKLSSRLMGEAALTINYSMKPLDTLETFFVSGSIKNFRAKQLDDFFRSSLQATAQGSVDQMYFTFSGDRYAATGDVKMKYEDFKLEVLRKDLLKINKVLSFIGNLLVNDGSNNDANGYRHGAIATKPDRTKSFPNYIWTCLKDGIIETITGKGKKKQNKL